MICSNLRSGNIDVDAYIEALEKEVKSFEASNTRKLIRSIDRMAGRISEQLDLISNDEKNADGTEVTLSNKFIDNFIKLAEKSEKIALFSKLADSMYHPKTSNETESTSEPTSTEVEQETAFSFEIAQKQIKEKLNGKSV